MPKQRELPHIFLRDVVTAEEYSYPFGGGTRKPLPERDRASHAARLQEQLEQAREQAQARSSQQAKAWALPAKNGVHLELESEPGFGLELQSLESIKQGIQLVAVREVRVKEDEQAKLVTLATIYVPEGKLENLEKKVQKYATSNTEKTGKPRHQKLIETIKSIRLAHLRSFWTDRGDLFPRENEGIWWEIWLRSPDDDVFERFQATIDRLGLRTGERSLEFLSTRILLAYGTLEQLSASVEAVDSIAELRRAKEVPSAFMEMSRELGPWVSDLDSRSTAPAVDSPRLCLHDTGVNAGHPLLRKALALTDCHAVDPGWRVDDHDGHGTGMAGLALYGDLTEALAGRQTFLLPARLESVKILPPPPGENDPDLYGRITEQAVYRVEVEQPFVRRTHAMAVTATDGRERGKPSSWSAAVDQLAFGRDDDTPRLWLLSAGNAALDVWGFHPDHLETEEIHDPGQAWNALTIGAYTERWQIPENDFRGWSPLSHPGDLSPSTSTSATWDAKWPLKPDVVAEGGNAARSPSGEIDRPDSLSLLTTHYRPADRLVTTFGETSAATALIARMASTLWSSYPDLWPETIRALIVHSGTWTTAMRQSYGPLQNKGDYARLIRRCGFGVPNLESAQWSASDRLTLIAQESMQPFVRKKSSSGQSSTTLKELHLYSLPWPTQQLRDLGEANVELRVTLSYFVEPNPSERGYKYRHRYASHGFRFDVRAADESLGDFRKRLTKAAREEEEGSPGTGDTSGWLVGSDGRHRGSIHSDIWRGSAVDLANRQHLAVFPVTGWWKERHGLEKWRRRARYALVVSIHSPEVEVDLYTPVSIQAGIPIVT